MIQPVQNTNYIGYANILFSYFQGFTAGQGGLLDEDNAWEI